MIFQSKIFWTLVAGLIAFVAKFFYPAFPLDEVQILALVVFVLNSFGINPELRARGLIK
jgi:hypothetical protein